MRKLLSYLLLFMYATIMIKPVMPTIADTFAHIFNYKDHIATVHKHNGKSHVHYDYIEVAKNNTNGEAPYNNTLKKMESSSEHIMFASLPFPCIIPVRDVSIKPLISQLPAIFFEEHFRPPITAHTYLI